MKEEEPSQIIEKLTDYSGVALDENENFVWKDGQWEERTILAIIKYFVEYLAHL